LVRRRIAVSLESFGLPARQAADAAARLGADAVEFDAVGPLSPRELSQTGRRDFRHCLRSRNLGLAAVGFPTRRGFDELDRLEARIEATAEAFRLAYDLGAPIVVNHIGKIPAETAAAERAAFREALWRVASAADKFGVRFAVQTGLDPPETLARYLADLNAHALAVNYAPANLVLQGVDLAAGVERLAPWLAGCHVRDVVRSGLATLGVREVPLGEGEIDWKSLLAALASVEYAGAYTIVREPPAPPEELAAAVEFLRG
jgi:sugar phosphate isomerase/epimerase